MSHAQASYDALFSSLGTRLRTGGWETRQEYPPGAYLHVSRSNWRDANLDGIHLEAYVMGGQLRSGKAVVALHCEGGWPSQFRKKFMENVTERARSAIESWNQEEGDLGRWKVKGPKGMSVCEALVPFGRNPEETMEKVETQLRRLQTLAGLVDETIERCCQETELKASVATVCVAGAGIDEVVRKEEIPWQISKPDVARNDGKAGRRLWVVIDGYVVDATDFANSHPGGLHKVLSTNDATTGWIGEAFGFSLSRGKNAHYPKTGKMFREGVDRFEKHQGKESVDVTYPSYGVITIIGKLV